MKLCLQCRRIWPRTAQFCGSCRGSFGGRLCPKMHWNPKSAQFCLTCGHRQLSNSTASLDLNWPVKLITLVAGLLLARLAFSHFSEIFSIALTAADRPFRFVTDMSIPDLIGTVARIAVTVGLLWLGISAIVGRKSAIVKGINWLTIRFLSTVPKAVSWLFRMIGQSLFNDERPERRGGVLK